jgi:uncharacterized protein (TIRG00374 family)
MRINRHSAGFDGRKLGLGVAVFVLLTVGVFWWQFRRIPDGGVAPTFRGLQWRFAALLVLLAPIESLCAGLRVWLVARALRCRVRFWRCLQSEWANFGLAMITPAQTGGGLAQAYVLSRAGVPFATALSVTVIAFLGTVFALLLMGAYSIFGSGLIRGAGALPATAAWILFVMSAAMIAIAVCPRCIQVIAAPLSRLGLRGLSARIVAAAHTFQRDVLHFLCAGKLAFAWVCGLTVVLFLSRFAVAYACVGLLGLSPPPLGRVVEMQTAITFLVYFAPTPGGAGVTEGASYWLMHGALPAGFAPHYHLLWRFVTAYLPALAGYSCLLTIRRRPVQKPLEVMG